MCRVDWNLGYWLMRWVWIRMWRRQGLDWVVDEWPELTVALGGHWQ